MEKEVINILLLEYVVIVTGSYMLGLSILCMSLWSVCHPIHIIML